MMKSNLLASCVFLLCSIFAGTIFSQPTGQSVLKELDGEWIVKFAASDGKKVPLDGRWKWKFDNEVVTWTGAPNFGMPLRFSPATFSIPRSTVLITSNSPKVASLSPIDFKPKALISMGTSESVYYIYRDGDLAFSIPISYEDVRPKSLGFDAEHRPVDRELKGRLVVLLSRPSDE